MTLNWLTTSLEPDSCRNPYLGADYQQKARELGLSGYAHPPPPFFRAREGTRKNNKYILNNPGINKIYKNTYVQLAYPQRLMGCKKNPTTQEKLGKTKQKTKKPIRQTTVSSPHLSKADRILDLRAIQDLSAESSLRR